MTPFATIRRYAALGLVTALLLALAWGARVDHLRAGYKAALGKILVSIDLTTGRKVDAATAPVTIEAIGILRDRYRQERNEARAVVDRQSASIRAAGGSIGPVRYAVLYNATSGGLIGFWDYGSAITLNTGETLTVDFDDAAGVLTLA